VQTYRLCKTFLSITILPLTSYCVTKKALWHKLDSFLGNLRYEEVLHGWAIDVGAGLATAQVAGWVEGLSPARQSQVQFINETLTQYNINYIVPEKWRS
jgi:hypothetical protein